tara:strand:- start:202 stop:1041 length:840 start_codon:yes stop_codon:yes gene_type:complete
MNKETKLGRGLGALLSTSNNKDIGENGIQKINISQIVPNPLQPRKNFKDDELKELSSSIKNQGLIQPIIVKPTNDNQFQIIAGERRWRACQINGMHEVDCVVKDLDDINVLEAALIENIQREDLNVIEEANAYKGLIDIKGINNENLSKLIGKSSSHISNILRLLELDKKIQEMVINGQLSMGHARALIGVPDAINKANEIIEKKLSVRQVEKITSQFKKSKGKKSTKDPNIIDLEKELSDKIGLKTSIQFNESGSSGSLTLYYSDLNQLDDLMKRLKK